MPHAPHVTIQVVDKGICSHGQLSRGHSNAGIEMIPRGVFPQILRTEINRSLPPSIKKIVAVVAGHPEGGAFQAVKGTGLGPDNEKTAVIHGHWLV